MGWDSILLSESYGVAVAVSFLAIVAAWSFVDNVLARAKPRPLAAAAGIVVVSLLVVAVGLLKISVIIVVLAAAAFLFVRLRLYRYVTLNLLFVGVVLSSFAALRLTSNPGYFSMPQSRLVLFGFLRANVDPQWWPDYWLVYYAWVWILAVVRMREEGIRTLGGLLNALRERRLLDLEFLFIAALVGLVPGLLITYSSTHYFSNVQQWLAVGFLLSNLIRRPGPSEMADLAGGASDQPSGAAPRVAGRSGLARLSIGRAVAAALILSVCGTDVSNTLVLLGRLIATNLVSRGHASGQTGLGLALMHGQVRAADRILAETASDVESRMKSDKNVLAILRSLDEMPLSTKRSSLLFIPQSNRQFWDLLHGPYWPADVPLVAPALSGVAMIDGLHVPKEAAKDIFWYREYSRSEAFQRQPPLDRYLPVLLRRCASLGFRQLIVIDVNAKGISEARCYDCHD